MTLFQAVGSRQRTTFREYPDRASSHGVLNTCEVLNNVSDRGKISDLVPTADWDEGESLHQPSNEWDMNEIFPCG
jgi:hypothetical protein